MSHSNISIFVPHIGCSHQCSFCNQKHITGQAFPPTAKDVHDAVKTALSSPSYNCGDCEIAFFGGSFTAIQHDYMTELLDTANTYVVDGKVKGIRISTRPDYIDSKTLDLLKSYGVTSIELGAQSMVDAVLTANERGHIADDVVKASMLIKEYGFELGLQMMTGLYKSSFDFDVETAKKIIELSPDTLRIYPTITLKNTKLADLYKSGVYIPPSLDETVDLCLKIIDLLEDTSIKIIRLGLHSIDLNAYVAGPWHPAFSELCASKRFCLKVEKLNLSCGNYIVYLNKSDVSKFIGQKRSNIDYFLAKGISFKVVPDVNVSKSNFVIKEVK